MMAKVSWMQYSVHDRSCLTFDICIPGVDITVFT